MKPRFKFSSVIWLEISLRKIFLKKFRSQVTFISEGADLLWQKNGPQDIVMLGDFPLILPQHKGFFPHPDNYRIWFLSQRARELCHKLYGIPYSRLGLIPRSAFGKVSAQKNLSPGKSIDLIYAGRLGPEKNVSSILDFAAAWNAYFHVPVRIHVFSQDTKGKNKLENDDITFTMSSDTEWHKRKFKRPVYFSMSQALEEDFGLSPFLARQNGWPCILSDWGGYKDISGSGTYHLPLSMKNNFIPFLKAPSDYQNNKRKVSWVIPATISASILKNAFKRSPIVRSQKWEKLIHSAMEGRE